MRSTKNGQGFSGGGTPRSIAGTGGGVNADSAPGIIDGVTIAAPAGKHLWFNVPDLLFGAQQAGLPLVARVPISSAEVLALHITPKVLVPAQGADAVVTPTLLLARYVPNTLPYTTLGTTFLYWGWGNGNEQNVRLEITDGLNGPALLGLPPLVPNDGTNMGLNGVPGGDLVLSTDAPLLGGNGTITVTVVYVLV